MARDQGRHRLGDRGRQRQGHSIAPANLLTIRNNLIHDVPGNGIFVRDPDTIVDIENNFVFNTLHGLYLEDEMSSGARVNVYNNTIYNSTDQGIFSPVFPKQPRVTLRNNIVHTSRSGTWPDMSISRPFNEAYFCTGVGAGPGLNPSGCGADIAGALASETANQMLPFTGVNTACLYLGSSQPFRGVGVSVVAPPSGSGANLQWDYWNGSWASLETGTFLDYRFAWDGFAYGADDPAGWSTRTVGGGVAPLYYVRVCRSGTDSSPTERLITRADVSIASRYNLTPDEDGPPPQPRGGGWGSPDCRPGAASGRALHLRHRPPLRRAARPGTPSSKPRARTAAGRPPRSPAGSSTTSTVRPDRHRRRGLRRPPRDSAGTSGPTSGDAPPWCLMSFDAAPSAAVDLSWRTGSELNNLGFHLHRSLSEGGPWTRITPSLIPGLGSSPEGASYSFRDTGLTNGVRYFYRLEDIDSESGSTFHGPVSAVPGAAPPAEEEDPGSSDPDPPERPRTTRPRPTDSSTSRPPETYGRPEAASFRVVSRTKRAMVVELRTPGFVATETPSGVKVSVPGFDQRTDPRAPDLPLKRVVLDAVVGRHARIVSVKETKHPLLPRPHDPPPWARPRSSPHPTAPSGPGAARPA